MKLLLVMATAGTFLIPANGSLVYHILPDQALPKEARTNTVLLELFDGVRSTNKVVGPISGKSSADKTTIDFSIDTELDPAIKYWIQFSTASSTNPAVFKPLPARHPVIAIPRQGILAEVQSGSRTPRHLLVLIGMLGVLLYGLSRFNTPASNRCSTTAGRYWSAAIIYAALGLAFYLFLIYSPEAFQLVKENAHGIPEAVSKLATPLLAAILLTTFLPNIPWLSTLDEKLRKRLQAFAEIPRAARLLAQDLAAADLNLTANLETAIHNRLIEEELNADDFVIKKGDTPQQLWARVVSFLEIAENSINGCLHQFAEAFPGELPKLQERYKALLPHARAYFRIEKVINPSSNEAVSNLRRIFATQTRELLDELCIFMSRALLMSSSIPRSRLENINRLGFVLPKIAENHFPPTLVVPLAAAIFFILAAMFAALPNVRSPGESAEDGLLKAIMIASIYATAILCGVVRDKKWTIARVGDSGVRPWLFYCLVALAAAVATFVIMNFFSFLKYHGDWNLIWLRFRYRYPFIVVGAMTAALISFSIDTRPSKRFSERKLRCLESLVHGAIAIAVACAVAFLLAEINKGGPFTAPRGEFLVPLLAVVGLIIGFFVPSWHRKYATQRIAGE